MSFDDIVGHDDLSPEEEAKLRRVHDLLVQAGPPPELPPALERPRRPGEARVPEFPLLMRRRVAVVTFAAAAAALVVFAIGYGLGHSKASSASFSAIRSVPMHGKAGRLGVIRIGSADSAGNWPMLVEVTGLPKQTNPAAYYELWLTRDGKPAVACGGFRVHGDMTTIRLTVPYAINRSSGWVVTAQAPPDRTLGPVVLTTV